MKKYLLLGMLIIGISLGLSNHLEAQAKKKQPERFSDHLWYGTGFGLGLSSNAFSLSLSPMVGYKITEHLSFGPRVIANYDYNKLIDASGQIYRLNNLTWGVGAFGRFKFLRSFFLHSEYNYLRVSEPASNGSGFLINPENPDQILTEKTNRTELNVGAGYTSGGRRLGYEIGLLYNLLEDSNSIDLPFSIRVGLNYNF